MARQVGLLWCALVALGCRTSEPADMPIATTHATRPATAAAGSPGVETARTPAPAPAQEFLYQGQPIHPLCIAELVAGEGEPVASLLDCGADAGAPIVDGASHRYEWPAALPAGRRPYVEYEVVLVHEGTVYVRHSYNGGGTGHFSGLTAISHEGSQIRTQQTIVGGDRCNGGLVEAAGKDGLLRYDIHLTPSDIIGLVPVGRRLKLVPYRDLEASAASCFATAHHRHDPSTRQTALVSVLFGDERMKDQTDWTKDYRYQSCFNQTYNRHLGQLLSPKELSAFVEQFAHDCLRRR